MGERAAQFAAEILEAIGSGRDLYLYDQYIGGGAECLERARKVLIERRDACSDAEEAGFLTSVIRGLETG